jgi:uncharacterized membrane protein YgdD (TMEM256/DUF423 family)
MNKLIIITAAFLGFLAVVLGAFAAHGLKGRLSAEHLDIWHTAVQYQFYHVFALLFLSTFSRFKNGLVTVAYYLFTLGIIFFSGSLYLLSTTEITHLDLAHIIGPITPIGGLLFIGGWIALGLAALRNK